MHSNTFYMALCATLVSGMPVQDVQNTQNDATTGVGPMTGRVLEDQAAVLSSNDMTNMHQMMKGQAMVNGASGWRSTSQSGQLINARFIDAKSEHQPVTIEQTQNQDSIDQQMQRMHDSSKTTTTDQQSEAGGPFEYKTIMEKQASTANGATRDMQRMHRDQQSQTGSAADGNNMYERPTSMADDATQDMQHMQRDQQSQTGSAANRDNMYEKPASDRNNMYERPTSMADGATQDMQRMQDSSKTTMGTDMSRVQARADNGRDGIDCSSSQYADSEEWILQCATNAMH